MLEFGLTNKIMDKMHIKKLSSLDEADIRFCWEINLTKMNNKNTLVIVHPSSRYCMIYSNLPRNIWKTLDEFVRNAIAEAFHRECFSNEDIDSYFELAGASRYTKTHGRKATGGMNRLMTELYFMEDIMDSDESFQADVTNIFNHGVATTAYYKEFNYITPKSLFVCEMRNLLYGEEITKEKAQRG